MPGRPLRDAEWWRTKYRELKGKLSVCFNNFHRSGNQDAENNFDEWIKFSLTFTGDVITYAIAIFNEQDLNQIGRALPQEVSRDTGALDPNIVETRRANAAARQRQRHEKRQRVRDGTDPAGGNDNSVSPMTSSTSSRGNTTSSNTASSNLTHLVQNSLDAYSKSQIRLTALNLVLTHGTPQQKADAMSEVNAILNPPQSAAHEEM